MSEELQGQENRRLEKCGRKTNGGADEEWKHSWWQSEVVEIRKLVSKRQGNNEKFLQKRSMEIQEEYGRTNYDMETELYKEFEQKYK